MDSQSKSKQKVDTNMIIRLTDYVGGGPFVVMIIATWSTGIHCDESTIIKIVFGLCTSLRLSIT